MADWQFELWITDTASDTYDGFKRIAEAAVLNGPLPLNCDPRLRPQLAVLEHFERTRRLLRSIRSPEDVRLDIGLTGPIHFVRYRVDVGTCIYFTRIVTYPPAVLVYAVSDAPLDDAAIRKLVAAGNAHLLEKMGLPLLPMNGSSSTIN